MELRSENLKVVENAELISSFAFYYFQRPTPTPPPCLARRQTITTREFSVPSVG